MAAAQRATAVSSSSPTPGSDPEVTPLELFFDLVFVFAVSQLSHHLVNHLSWRGALETLVLLVAAFSVWASTSWNASLPDMGRRHEAIAIAIVMPLGLAMNAGIGRAFDGQPWLFAAPFLLAHLQRGVTPLVSARSPLLREHFTRQFAWIVASSVLWVGGALAAPEQRLAWWGAAALLDLVGTWSAHWIPGRRLRSEAVPFTASYMIERSRAFLLVALGEAIVTTGAGLADTPANALGLVAAALALALIAALWGIYFAGSARLVDERAEQTDNPLGLARLAVNSQPINLAALIAIAAATGIGVVHADERTGASVALLLFGGAGLFVMVQAWYRSRLSGQVPRSGVVTVVVLAVAAAISVVLPAVLALALAALVLVALCLTITRAGRSPLAP